jgi:hypothetical protein
MDDIKNTIKNIVNKLEKNTQAKSIVEVWDNIIDEETFKKTKVENKKYGTLVIAVEDHATMYMLNMKKHKIIEQINEQIKEDNIERIRFKIKKVN